MYLLTYIAETETDILGEQTILDLRYLFWDSVSRAGGPDDSVLTHVRNTEDKDQITPVKK